MSKLCKDPHRLVQPHSLVRWFRPLAAVIAVGLTAGCGTEIGDSCSTNVDCSTTGTRICDLAQPGGYCTVQSCTAASCPDGAVCVAFYPTQFLNRPCNPETEDAVGVGAAPTNDCTSNEVCLRSGFCALPTLAQRFCMKRCSGDGDCRGGYSCGGFGLFGAEPVIDSTAPDRALRTFCAQTPSVMASAAAVPDAGS